MVEVRAASKSDLREILELAIRVFTITFEKDNNPDDFKAYMSEAFTENKIEEEYNEAGSQFFVAADGPVIVGYARLRKNDEVNEMLGESNVEIQRLYVDQPWQGKGVASGLMTNCESHAKSLGVEWIWLGVWEHNPKAQRFYSKLGYEKFSEHSFMVGTDKQTDWLMRKKLN